MIEVASYLNQKEIDLNWGPSLERWVRGLVSSSRQESPARPRAPIIFKSKSDENRRKRSFDPCTAYSPLLPSFLPSHLRKFSTSQSITNPPLSPSSHATSTHLVHNQFNILRINSFLILFFTIILFFLNLFS